MIIKELRKFPKKIKEKNIVIDSDKIRITTDLRLLEK